MQGVTKIGQSVTFLSGPLSRRADYKGGWRPEGLAAAIALAWGINSDTSSSREIGTASASLV